MTTNTTNSQSPKRKSWITMIFFSLAITFYAMVVGASLIFEQMTDLIGEPLLQSYNDRPLSFILHIIFGGIALLSGAINGYRPLVRNHRRIHRNLGRIYVVSIIISSISGLIMARYSAIGIVDHIGFGLLAILWFVTTIMGYLKIRGRHVVDHREWMMRSFSLTFAAVTLRIWNPLLIMTGVLLGYSDPFAFAYPMVAFLAWVPNIVVVEWYIMRNRGGTVESEVTQLLSVVGN